MRKVVLEGEYLWLKSPPEPEHKFEVTLEEDCFSEEKYQLFRNYQHHIHHEPISEISTSKGFERFLCTSPLIKSTRRVRDVEQKLGSYHQCYRLDGRLIAMAVLDLLPNGVSAVYFIYHVDFERWSFGKVSALREIALALKSEREYYYMGYYIHSCAKMRYKGDYRIQQVLDPESYDWNPLNDEMKRLLDLKSYISMSHENDLSEVTTGKELMDYAKRKIFDTPSKAAKAASEGLSLFKIAMPGVLTEDDVRIQIDLNSIKVEIGPKKIYRTMV